VLNDRLVSNEDITSVQSELSALVQGFAGLSRLGAARALDIHTWLYADILPKVDLSSMAHGLEVRSPFLDYRFLSYCIGLPDQYLRRRSNGKRILKRVAAGLVPAAILSQPKQGFNAPVPHWFRGPLNPFAREVFAKAAERTDGLLDSQALIELLDAHERRKIDVGYFLWAVLVLLVWIEGNLA
jgi:asparagine synthase (glutamine-hydrolysing)